MFRYSGTIWVDIYGGHWGDRGEMNTLTWTSGVCYGAGSVRTRQIGESAYPESPALSTTT